MKFGLKVSDGTASTQPRGVRLLPRGLLGPRAAADDGHDGPGRAERQARLVQERRRPSRLKADEACATTKYRIDGGAWQDYGQPFTVTGEGNHMVEYYSVDKAEEPNMETIKTLSLRVDSAAPQTEVTLGGDMRAGGTVDVQLDAADGDLGSGVGLTQYRVDGGPWTAYKANGRADLRRHRRVAGAVAAGRRGSLRAA